MADSPDQRPLNMQKWRNCACELKTHIPNQSKKHRGHMSKTPHTTPRKHTLLSWPASGYD